MPKFKPCCHILERELELEGSIYGPTLVIESLKVFSIKKRNQNEFMQIMFCPFCGVELKTLLEDSDND